MKYTKEQLQDMWHNAPIKQFLECSTLEAEELKQDGLEVTEDWARAMYLLQEYSGGGYLTALTHTSFFHRFIKGRFNVPYGNQVAQIFFEEQLYTFHYDRNIETLLLNLEKKLGNIALPQDSELSLILSVIEENTGGHSQYLQLDNSSVNSV